MSTIERVEETLQKYLELWRNADPCGHRFDVAPAGKRKGGPLDGRRRFKRSLGLLSYYEAIQSSG